VSVAIGLTSYVSVLTSNFMKGGSDDLDCCTVVTDTGCPSSSLMLGNANFFDWNYSISSVDCGAEVK
jgi:hypothetical protein